MANQREQEFLQMMVNLDHRKQADPPDAPDTERARVAFREKLVGALPASIDDINSELADAGEMVLVNERQQFYAKRRDMLSEGKAPTQWQMVQFALQQKLDFTRAELLTVAGKWISAVRPKLSDNDKLRREESHVALVAGDHLLEAHPDMLGHHDVLLMQWFRERCKGQTKFPFQLWLHEYANNVRKAMHPQDASQQARAEATYLMPHFLKRSLKTGEGDELKAALHEGVANEQPVLPILRGQVNALVETSASVTSPQKSVSGVEHKLANRSGLTVARRGGKSGSE